MIRKLPQIFVGQIWNTWTCTQADKCGYWIGKCGACGSEQRIRAWSVHHERGNAKCKNCWRGQSKHYLYKVWVGMRQRCSNPNVEHYAHYGGKGIKVCDRWRSFENFVTDMGDRPAGHTLERKDRLGNYAPDNCKWATGIEQHSNTSRNRHVTCFGERMVCSHAARKIGVSSEYLSIVMRRFDWPDIDVGMLPQVKITSFLLNWLKGSCRIEFV